VRLLLSHRRSAEVRQGVPARSRSLESVAAAEVMFGAHKIEHAIRFSRRDAMPIYISRGRFTSDAVKGMLAVSFQ
jgi:hypothetical protein